MRESQLFRPLFNFAIILGAALLVFGGSALARDAQPLAEIEAAKLPSEARETLALIRKGGPFPHRQDGTRFGNREKRLPLKDRDHYREYTVKTPGAPNRGPRRIVAGAAGELYYSDDHYNSFKRIRE